MGPSPITALIPFGSRSRVHAPGARAISHRIHCRRTVNPTVYTRKQLAKRRQEDTAFVKRVLGQPKVWLIGSDDVLAA